MYKQKIEDSRKQLDEAVIHFQAELAKVRTGRANPALVENVSVEYYGARTPLIQIASITAPEPRLIVIQPWDISAVVAIEAAIKASGLGLNPSNDGRVVRIAIPQLTEERRKELVKVLNKLTEDGRIAVRNVREKVWREVQDLEEAGEIAEDDKFRGKDELQKIVDEYNKKMEEIREKKEKEIMTV